MAALSASAGPGAGAREPKRRVPPAAAGDEPAPGHQSCLRRRPLHVPLPGKQVEYCTTVLPFPLHTATAAPMGQAGSINGLIYDD